MHGVTTAIVGFILVCIIFPHLVKNRPQFYAAFAAVVLTILLDSVAHITAGAFANFAYAMIGVLQIVALLLLFLSAGGLTWRELGGDMAKAIEVIRRGEEQKEIIIPLTGRQPGVKSAEDEPRPRIEINDPAPAPRKPSDDDPSLPIM